MWRNFSEWVGTSAYPNYLRYGMTKFPAIRHIQILSDFNTATELITAAQMGSWDRMTRYPIVTHISYACNPQQHSYGCNPYQCDPYPCNCTWIDTGDIGGIVLVTSGGTGLWVLSISILFRLSNGLNRILAMFYLLWHLLRHLLLYLLRYLYRYYFTIPPPRWWIIVNWVTYKSKRGAERLSVWEAIISNYTFTQPGFFR